MIQVSPYYLMFKHHLKTFNNVGRKHIGINEQKILLIEETKDI